jgi:hypothetical protein
MRTVLLVLHISAGAAGLLLGAAAIVQPKRPGWHARTASVYIIAVMIVCATAIGLVLLQPGLWWLGLIAVATAGAALAGGVLAARRPPGWAGRSVRLLSMSYVSLVTALLVVSVPVPVTWAVPTLIGEPLIHRATRAARRREAMGASRSGVPDGMAMSSSSP